MNAAYTFAFRVAADASVGGGHVVRTLAIANALADIGAVCHFFVADKTTTAVHMLNQSRHQVTEVPVQTTAAVEEIAEANLEPFDWMIVDDYSLEAVDETVLRNVAGKILIIDDLANRPHDCDLLLDSRPDCRQDYYNGLVAAGVHTLIGRHYAPLRAEFFEGRDDALAKRARTKRSERLLISFGLIDPGGITAAVTSAMAAAFPALMIDVVLGSKAASLARVEKIARDNSHVALHVAPPSMSQLMIDADIAIGAGGSTGWERACLGLPAVALILADNQRALAGAFGASGACTATEIGPDVLPQVIAAVGTLINEPARWKTMSDSAALTCDGLGGRRVASWLVPPLSGKNLPVRLRPAEWMDADRIYDWQTERGARAYFSMPSAPTREEHQEWMRRRLGDPGCLLNIIEHAGTAAGVLRFDRNPDHSFTVSILLSGKNRGQGIGLAALRAGAALLQGRVLRAKVDDHNAASLRIFASAGFTPQGNGLYQRG